MNAVSSWSYEHRLQVLREIALACRQTEASAAVAAIAEYNRMIEAAARNPGLHTGEEANSPDEPLPNVFTPATLAERWDCSQRHIRHLISTKQLSFFRIGNLIRIKTADVIEYEHHIARPPAKLLEPVPSEATAEEMPRKRKKPVPRLDTPEMRARWKLQDKRGS